ncbi:hypothetical protein V4F39_06685 [Aquincola sp. MAHUQ-54]|uniref:EthD domain-containing protein n=1 Tax=Aquincola agrisoli TaxID=3119538 RepID=A0AAW9QEW5_9BURK
MVDAAPADVLLAWFTWPAEGQPAPDLPALAAAGVHAVYRAVDGSDARAYARPGADAQAIAQLLPGAVLLRLQSLMQRDGASAEADAPFHYVVATDVVPEHEADFNAWYETEHAPGLAAVPGTVHAARYRSSDAERGSLPRYHACYDLQSPDGLTSAPWLAVRATDWSSRVRPQFRNTHRTMYRRVAGLRSTS